MTAYELRSSDWSSDVCSSDLTGNSCSLHNTGWQEPPTGQRYYPTDATVDYVAPIASMGHPRDKCHAVRDGDPGNCRTSAFGDGNWELGSASCRARVCQ